MEDDAIWLGRAMGESEARECDCGDGGDEEDAFHEDLSRVDVAPGTHKFGPRLQDAS
jgi:hypothetical protein